MQKSGKPTLVEIATLAKDSKFYEFVVDEM